MVCLPQSSHDINFLTSYIFFSKILNGARAYQRPCSGEYSLLLKVIMRIRILCVAREIVPNNLVRRNGLMVPSTS